MLFINLIVANEEEDGLFLKGTRSSYFNGDKFNAPNWKEVDFQVQVKGSNQPEWEKNLILKYWNETCFSS